MTEPTPAAGGDIPGLTPADWSRFWQTLARLIADGDLTADQRAAVVRDNAQLDGTASAGTDADANLGAFVSLPFTFPPAPAVRGAPAGVVPAASATGPTMTPADWSRLWDLFGRLIHNGDATPAERAAVIEDQARQYGTHADAHLRAFVDLPFNY